MLEFLRRERGLILFRKHVVKYVRGLAHIAQVKARLVTCTRPEEFIELMHQYEVEAGERTARELKETETALPAPEYCCELV